MNIRKAILERRSVRNYRKDIPYLSVIEDIISTADNAPSAGNLKPRFVEIIDDKEKKEEISKICRQEWMNSSPYLIIVLVDLIKASMYGKRGMDLYCIQDSAAMIQNILLLATEYELATCWVGAFDEIELALYLNLPEDIRPVAIITIGVEKK